MVFRGRGAIARGHDNRQGKARASGRTARLAALLATSALCGATASAAAAESSSRLSAGALDRFYPQLASGDITENRQLRAEQQARQEQQAQATRSFDIPPQSLSSALTAFGRQSGLQVAADTGLVAGLSSSGVTGSHTAEQALELLLAGTGLDYAISANGTVTLQRAAAQRGPMRLGPVMVTGEKTVRSLQDTATSVSVVTSEDLEARPGISTLDQTYKRMPNVVGTGTGNFAPTIRGDDATGPANGVFAFLGGTRPRVTIQQDGRSLTFDELIYGRTDLWDVERVEVLRGPQTTLQGRNSIAGAIIVETKDPTFEYEADARAIIGDYMTRQFSGVVSGPLVEDQIAFRLAADWRNSDSWVDVEGDVGVDEPEEERLRNIRGKLLFLPNGLPDLTAQVTLEHIETRRPQTEFVTAPFSDRRNDGSVTFPVFENETNSAVLEVDYALTSHVELRNTTSYANIQSDRLTLPFNGNVDSEANEVSNELIAEYDGSELDGILGTYFFYSDRDETIDIGNGSFDDQTQTVALFGEGTYTFWQRWDLTLGGRYEREKRERQGTAAIYEIDLDETYGAFLPKFGLAYRPTDDTKVGATVQRGWNAGGAGVAFVPPFPSYSYDPEYVWNYEAYFRSSWLDDRLTVNGNIFYADYTDQQRLAYLNPADPNSGVIRNADKSHAYGAELSASWLPPVDGLEVYGSLGLLKTKIEEFSASAQDVTGNEFARAPDVTASFGALYRHDSGVTAGFDGRYVGAYFSDDDNVETEEVDPYVLFDAQLGYETDGLRVFAFVNNIFNSDAELLLFDGTAQMVDPREFGVGLEMHF